MPRYDYYCPENSQTVEVSHGMSVKLKCWQQVCELAGIDLGAISPDAPVERIITQAPMANTPTGNVGLKELGFTKLVKRDDGVYENVTRGGTEKRYMNANDPSSMPHFNKKMTD